MLERIVPGSFISRPAQTCLVVLISNSSLSEHAVGDASKLPDLGAQLDGAINFLHDNFLLRDGKQQHLIAKVDSPISVRSISFVTAGQAHNVVTPVSIRHRHGSRRNYHGRPYTIVLHLILP